MVDKLALEHADLARYPRGGFHRVLDALAKVGERFGVDYRLSTSVSKVNFDHHTKRTTGVTLSTGEVLHSDLVLVNADLVYAYSNLLPRSGEARRLSRKPASCSSISFYCMSSPAVHIICAHSSRVIGQNCSRATYSQCVLGR
jgi:phytoene desaturase (3,4-didehydrolycopene-forming)